MSWMDSWSRPTKHAASPPPFYLLPNQRVETPYCHTCGRVIASRKTQSHTSPVKYCSTRCRNNKLGPIDHSIEDAFTALLEGRSWPPQTHRDDCLAAQSSKTRRRKGESRVLITCDVVEAAVFGPRHDAEKTFGRKKNRARRGVPDPKVWTSVDMEEKPGSHEGAYTDANEDDNNEDSDGSSSGIKLSTNDPCLEMDKDYINFGGGKVRASQVLAEVNGSIGGEKGWAERIEETTEMRAKRAAGQRRAEEREMVRRAARRGCAFGFTTDKEMNIDKEKAARRKKEKAADEEKSQVEKIRRKCEAIMNGEAVEASFAKGDWGIRWREDGAS